MRKVFTTFRTFSSLFRRYWRYISNSLWLIADRLLASLVGLLVVAVVARYLGPSEFGLLSYTFSMALLFAVAGQLGLDGLVIREIVNRPDDVPCVLGTVFVLKFSGHLLGAAGLVVYALSIGVHSTERSMLFLAAAFIPLASLSGFFGLWFHSRVQARYSAISSSISALLVGLGKLGLVWIGAAVMAFAAANVVQVLIAAMLSFRFYRQQKGPPLSTWRFSPALAKVLLSESWMLFLGSIFAIVYLKIDMIMLRWLAGPAEVGTYAVAATLSEAAYFVPAALVASVFPKLIESAKRDQNLFGKQLQTVFDVLWLAGLGLIATMFLLGGPLIRFLFGTEYGPSVPVLLVHVLSAPFLFMRIAFTRWTIIGGGATFFMLTEGLGAVTNVALNFLLIPHYGSVGAALATLVSYATASYLTLAIPRRTRPIFVMMSRSAFMPWRTPKEFLNYVRRIAFA
ncbi:flippase [Mesorhizobium sp. M9A.F.Ca.ET.002.03.1.2]|uniref:flippase n=1 Tax=Mesorhizobium sp. M9A.F.Ca.ET.002.03.1.2 TaxID=2493668 RepID=UPI000F75E63A|nr:flippase [Mesorhizobium sp. M9A.F.Ca.ET.002.03.1.2]AZN98679.1 flippase [Mesorhizobium sp. M9A.F.Ca.ET.002.03.1.2]